MPFLIATINCFCKEIRVGFGGGVLMSRLSLLSLCVYVADNSRQCGIRGLFIQVRCHQFRSGYLQLPHSAETMPIVRNTSSHEYTGNCSCDQGRFLPVNHCPRILQSTTIIDIRQNVSCLSGKLEILPLTGSLRGSCQRAWPANMHLQTSNPLLLQRPLTVGSLLT